MTLAQNTINAYPYQQYADDDNIQALFNAYNGATQYYVVWFATIGLPYYPGLTDGLLNWVAQGLYGLARTALQSPVQPTFGPLNTVTLNDTTPANGPAGQLNYFAFPVVTIYNVTDDFFQRILTWDMYKADGKRFSIPWLKRRIMRFLTWTNGAPPDPTVGPEDTSAISVTVTGTTPPTFNVFINQARLSFLVPNLTPGVVSVFNAAFTGNALELPIMFDYAATTVTHLTASVAPSNATSISNTTSQTTNSVTVSVSGGSGSYTYAWAFSSGGSGISITSATAATTTFSTTGLSTGTKVSGTATCTVTDTVTSNTATVNVPVLLENAAAIVVTLTPTVINAQGSTATLTEGVTNVAVTGGIPPYVSYAWSWQSGGSGIAIDSPTTALTNFTASGLAPGGSDSGTAQVVVTDSVGGTGTGTISVTLSRANVPVVVVTPSSLSVTGASSSESAGSSTASVSGGGVAPFTYAWSWQSGGSGITIGTPTSATASFSSTGLSPGETRSGTALVTVTDSLGGQGTNTVTVTIARVTLLSSVVSPGSFSLASIATTQTTGSATVVASGGQPGYNYAWTWSSGGGNITINSPSSNVTSFTGSGMAAGNTYSGVAQCVTTDSLGQTATSTVSVSITCNQALYIYTNQAGATFTIPNGTSLIVLECEAASGGAGAAGSGSICGGPAGAGGGAAGYCRSQFSVTSANWGQTINIPATNTFFSAQSITGGTFSMTTMTSNPGASAVTHTPGVGGTASGGNQANTTGRTGGTVPGGGTGGSGATPTATVNGGAYGGGGNGGGSGNVPPEQPAKPGGVVVKIS